MWILQDVGESFLLSVWKVAALLGTMLPAKWIETEMWKWVCISVRYEGGEQARLLVCLRIFGWTLCLLWSMVDGVMRE